MDDAYGHGHAGPVQHPIEIESHLPPRESLHDKLIRDRAAMYEAMDAEDEASAVKWSDEWHKNVNAAWVCRTAIDKMPFLSPDTAELLREMVAKHYGVSVLT